MTNQDVPIAIRIEQDEWLVIEWRELGQRWYRISELRKLCPCATCREKRTGDSQPRKNALPVLRAEELAPLRILQMRPVGNYAYQIAFSDGHGSGIFSIEMLLEMAASPCGPSTS